jgi:sterol desaturase/sphingolipid hydroxylase (fatty acid hydroxylase superfamily)
MRQIIGPVIALAILAGVYGILQRFWPALPRQKFYRPGFWTDLSYWLLGPILNRGFGRLVLILLLLPLAYILGMPPQDLRNGWGPVSQWPSWIQALCIIIIGDFLGYWTHRFTHQGWWWRVHSIHHSSRQLDWLAAARLHPFNEALGLTMRVFPLVLIGFAPIAVAGVQGFFTLFAVTLHANLNWDYGPLRSVIASPRFHRWHHTSALEGRDKNFAGLLPVWDIIFGTYYMPIGVEPDQFGIDTQMPVDLWGQLIAPFRTQKRITAAAE